MHSADVFFSASAMFAADQRLELSRQEKKLNFGRCSNAVIRATREIWRKFAQIMSNSRQSCGISLGGIRHFGFWNSLPSADLTDTYPRTANPSPTGTPLTMV